MMPSASSRAPPNSRKRTVSAVLDSDGEEITVLKVVKNKGKSTQDPHERPEWVQHPDVSRDSKPQPAKSMAAAQDTIHWRTPLGPAQSCLVGEYRRALQDTASRSNASSLRKQRIAAFDLDGNLIETSSGRAAYHFVDENDFRIWGRTSEERSAVKTRLQQEYQNGSLILILTNQLNLGQKEARLQVWKARLDQILGELGVPAVILASLSADKYRKPGAGWINELRTMWYEARGEKELDFAPGETADPADETRSFFVGDAAGRTATKDRAKDFADTDRKLAHNLGWRFLTPEEYFAGEEPSSYEWNDCRPAISRNPNTASSSKTKLQDLRSRLLKSDTDANIPRLLVLVGPQASGKSFFAKRLEAESKGQWVRVNQDTLKTREKCLKAVEAALKEGKSVVVDNTNPAKATRALYTTMAKKLGVKRTVCVHFDLTLKEAQHNDAFRSKRWLFPEATPSTQREALITPMPATAFRTYFKALEKPTKGSEEGFTEVMRVGFEFDGDQEEEKAWRLWYL